MAMAQVVMQLHVAQRGKAVEPGVGHGFKRLGKTVFADALDQLVALTVNLDRPGLAGNQGGVALRLARGNLDLAVVVRQAQQVGSGRDGGDEVFAGLRGVGLEFGFVHGWLYGGFIGQIGL